MSDKILVAVGLDDRTEQIYHFEADDLHRTIESEHDIRLITFLTGTTTWWVSLLLDQSEKDVKNYANRGGCNPPMTLSSICIILHNLGKPNP